VTTEQTKQMELDQPRSRLGRALLTSKVAQASEITVVFLAAFVVFVAARPRFGESPVGAWLAVGLMIALVWLGLRLRGQTWSHFGLTFRPGTRRSVVRTFLQSLVVSIGAIGAFVGAAFAMAAIVGQPDQAEAGGFDALQGNLPMLVGALLVVYVTASFSEEVIYRGFLMNRIAELGSGSKGAWALAVVISSVAFGLAHFAWGPAGMVQTGFMGLALGLSYLAVGRKLWVTILAHAYMDTILLLQMYFM
jgi:hypothetical protein